MASKAMAATMSAIGTAGAAQEGKTLVERLGHPKDRRFLMIHLDDIGMCHSVNVASTKALTEGVGSSGSVYRTTNGGRTWQRQESGVDVDLFDVKFVDAQEGWAVGAEGTIIHTTNGGGTWSTERSGTQHQLERVFFTDKEHGWAVGFGGTVVAYVKRQAV